MAKKGCSYGRRRNGRCPPKGTRAKSRGRKSWASGRKMSAGDRRATRRHHKVSAKVRAKLKRAVKLCKRAFNPNKQETFFTACVNHQLWAKSKTARARIYDPMFSRG